VIAVHCVAVAISIDLLRMTVLLDVIFLSVYRLLIAENYIGLLLHVISVHFSLLGWGLCLGVLLAC
jgi:hypothetical protein